MRKNQIINKIWVVVVSTIFLLACVEEVDPPSVQNYTPELIVNSVISPYYANIKVEISKSRYAFSFIPQQQVNDNIVINANVMISDGTRQKVLMYDPEELGYMLSTSDFPILPGQTYYLDADVDGHSIHAETTVPAAGITEIDIQRNKELRNILYSFTFLWRDIPDQDNYYTIWAIAFVRHDDNTVFEETLFYRNMLLQDNFRDGQMLSSVSDLVSLEYERITVQLGLCDKIYFDYYSLLDANDTGGDDPFSEPTQLPSNVEGALGMFSAIYISEVTFEAPF